MPRKQRDPAINAGGADPPPRKFNNLICKGGDAAGGACLPATHVFVGAPPEARPPRVTPIRHEPRKFNLFIVSVLFGKGAGEKKGKEKPEGRGRPPVPDEDAAKARCSPIHSSSIPSDALPVDPAEDAPTEDRTRGSNKARVKRFFGKVGSRLGLRRRGSKLAAPQQLAAADDLDSDGKRRLSYAQTRQRSALTVRVGQYNVRANKSKLRQSEQEAISNEVVAAWQQRKGSNKQFDIFTLQETSTNDLAKLVGAYPALRRRNYDGLAKQTWLSGRTFHWLLYDADKYERCGGNAVYGNRDVPAAAAFERGDAATRGVVAVLRDRSVWALLRDRRTGREFHAVSYHGPNANAESWSTRTMWFDKKIGENRGFRAFVAAQVLHYMHAVARETALPVVFGGDFNVQLGEVRTEFTTALTEPGVRNQKVWAGVVEPWLAPPEIAGGSGAAPLVRASSLHRIERHHAKFHPFVSATLIV